MISIIVPVYNVAPYIEECLNSVIAQTYKGEMECIVVDDCGTDNSIAICKRIINAYEGNIEFKIVSHDHNRGLSAARNTGVDVASGEFLIHLDSDDWLESNAVELFARKQHETDADIVSGNAIMHKIEGNQMLIEPDYADNMAMVRNTIEMTIDHVIWRRLIRKELYVKNDIRAKEGVNIGEDHHTLPRLAYYARTVTRVNDVVYHYNCMNPMSYMSRKVSAFNYCRFDSDLASLDVLLGFFAGKDDYCTTRLTEIRYQFVNEYLHNAYCLGDWKAYCHVAKFKKNAFPYWMYWTYWRLEMFTCKIKNKVISVGCRVKQLFLSDF